ncbi:hypothetical protein ACHHYP_14008 [Achlya hypogyna]|uniref:Ankyrin repeat protein n=1 Tax=Achlya hypogyna TaxID=1202772 RepID=A0A1V9YEA8_ACHHY|nr:hypothetical protein ACHHYP_14008 [Achlya hypogyna]
MGGEKLAALLAKAKSLERQKAPVERPRRGIDWWISHYGNATVPGPEKDRETVQAVYAAIVANDVYALRRCCASHRHLLFIKRTALYVASMLGKLECVRELLALGADPQLCCAGYSPADVAGLCVKDPIATMKIKHAFGAFVRPQVLLAQHAMHNNRRCRIDIHFSEPIWDFTPEDVVLVGCERVAFTLYTEDFFALIVQLTEAGECSVAVPEGAARRKKTGLYLLDLASSIVSDQQRG